MMKKVIILLISSLILNVAALAYIALLRYEAREDELQIEERELVYKIIPELKSPLTPVQLSKTIERTFRGEKVTVIIGKEELADFKKRFPDEKIGDEEQWNDSVEWRLFHFYFSEDGKLERVYYGS